MYKSNIVNFNLSEVPQHTCTFEFLSNVLTLLLLTGDGRQARHFYLAVKLGIFT